MSGSRGGRPTAADAALLADRIVDAAAELFLGGGYAATSIEAIASRAGVAKRTLYARFADKSTVFRAVTDRLIAEWLAGFDDAVGHASTIDEALLVVARKTLDVALTPTALALHAMLTAEARRFPELTQALRAAGADAGTIRVASLLRQHDERLTAESAARIAALFQGMVVHTPQGRAIAGAPPLDETARDAWCRAAVAILLHGLGPFSPAA